MIDLALVTRQLDAMPPPTNDQAAALLKPTIASFKIVIDEASSLPGETTRATVRAELEALAKIAASGPPAGVFSDVPRLKKALTRAAIETNAVSEGNATLGRARAQLFQDLADNAAAVAKTIATVAGLAIGTELLLAGVAIAAWLYFSRRERKEA